MDRLAEILKTELEKYTGEGAKCMVLAFFDDVRHQYAITIMDYPEREEPANLLIQTRIIGDRIVIDEDFTDKPLVDALVQAGVPRDRIILVYDGEKLPEIAAVR